MSKVYLGIGGNIGDKKDNIKKALELLQGTGEVQINKVSSYYETEPVGYKDQEWFLNVVAEAETELSPLELLQLCNAVEHKLKRVRSIRWGPRTIDIDILLYDELAMDDERLTIPHPRMKERGFVIIPLNEIAPSIKVKGESIESILSKINCEEIRRLYD